MIEPRNETQERVFEALMEPAFWVGLAARPVTTVERIETHGALVFIAGDVVLKIKRAVRLAYLDFSTLARRKAVCDRELALNRPAAPDIYRAVVAINRAHDGRIAVDGAGPVVEWAILMTRFEQDALLEKIAVRAGISPSLARDLAEMAVESHARAPVVHDVDTGVQLAKVASTITASLVSADIAGADDFGRDLDAAIDRRRIILQARSAGGCVRRCHGDLHLGNIVLWRGRPLPFDAIEFDEDLATVDTLYDLAFLLMDLDRHGCRSAANIVLGRYLWRARSRIDLDGLALLPLFLAVRAGVRAMVRADRARQLDGPERDVALDRVRQTFALAQSYLRPEPARLVAVGGLSGTGKSTLAAALAPDFGAAPGALHLRSDLERKALAGVSETDRLPPEAYSAAESARTYGALFERAGWVLEAGHAVVVDAVFAKADERAQIAALARSRGLAFTGLWLEAREDVMKARVAGRTGDASDATVDVVDRQLGYDPGAIDWMRLDAGEDASTTLAEARRVLNLSPRCDP